MSDPVPDILLLNIFLTKNFLIIIKFYLYDISIVYSKNCLEVVDLPMNALDNLNWKLGVMEEMNALNKNSTWVVDLPRQMKKVGCNLVFTIKCKADGSIERHKVRLVAKHFTQTYIDYQDTFVQLAKINSI